MPYFLVSLSHGPEWDPSRPRREQRGWDEHAAFMDAQTDRGSVVLGGPLGDDVDAGDALILVRADDADAARALFDDDPWSGRVITVARVQRWTFWLGEPASSVPSD